MVNCNWLFIFVLLLIKKKILWKQERILKKIISRRLRGMCSFIDSYGDKGGMTQYKTKKARTKYFCERWTMKNDVRVIDFIGETFNN